MEVRPIDYEVVCVLWVLLLGQALGCRSGSETTVQTGTTVQQVLLPTEPNSRPRRQSIHLQQWNVGQVN